MSDKKNLDKQIPNNVVALGANKCKAEDCKAKPTKADFCPEHFDWFKAGLITMDGKKPVDFDKKFYQYQQTRNKKVA